MTFNATEPLTEFCSFFVYFILSFVENDSVPPSEAALVFFMLAAGVNASPSSPSSTFASEASLSSSIRTKSKVSSKPISSSSTIFTVESVIFMVLTLKSKNSFKPEPYS